MVDHNAKIDWRPCSDVKKCPSLSKTLRIQMRLTTDSRQMMNEVHFKEDPSCGLSPSANPCANCVTATPPPRYIQRAVNGPAPCEGVIMRDAGEKKREKKKQVRVTNWSNLVCIKVSFFCSKGHS